MAKLQLTNEDDALLAELGVEIEEKKNSNFTPRQERIMAGFEEIVRFYETHGRLPVNDVSKDIFERIYAVRLAQVCTLEECVDLLKDIDQYDLLQKYAEQLNVEIMDDDALLAELGMADVGMADVGMADVGQSDMTQLTHVKTRAQVRSEADEVAQRKPCADFESFKPLFDQVQLDLKTGVRVARPYGQDATLNEGAFYIVGGQKAYIAEVGEWFVAKYGKKDARLRVIFDNGTQSNMLYRSFQKSLNADEMARCISDPDAGPLFEEHIGEDDTQSGTIYVLRSLSEHPLIKERREIIHKIGVTGGRVAARISNPKVDPTFLMADVEVVATYELYNINRSRLEHLIHRFFEAAKLDIEVLDRFGQPVVPQEWFLVPIFIIDEVVDKLKSGSLTNYVYDIQAVKLIER